MRRGETGTKHCHHRQNPPAGVAVTPASGGRRRHPGVRGKPQPDWQKARINECTSCSGTSSSSLADLAHKRRRRRRDAARAHALTAIAERRLGGSETATERGHQAHPTKSHGHSSGTGANKRSECTQAHRPGGTRRRPTKESTSHPVAGTGRAQRRSVRIELSLDAFAFAFPSPLMTGRPGSLLSLLGG